MCMQYTVFNFKITAYTTTNHLIFLVFNSSKNVSKRLLYKRRNITRNNGKISKKKNHFKLQLSIYPIQTHSKNVFTGILFPNLDNQEIVYFIKQNSFSIFVQLLMVTQAFQKGIS
jgi:hypothetical protein